MGSDSRLQAKATRKAVQREGLTLTYMLDSFDVLVYDTPPHHFGVRTTNWEWIDGATGVFQRGRNQAGAGGEFEGRYSQRADRIAEARRQVRGNALQDAEAA